MVPAAVRVLVVVRDLVVVLVVALVLKVVLRRRIQDLVAEDKVLKILHRRQNPATLLILLSLILVATLEATADLVTLAIAAVLTLLGEAQRRIMGKHSPKPVADCTYQSISSFIKCFMRYNKQYGRI